MARKLLETKMNDLVEKIKSQLDIVTALKMYTSADMHKLRNGKCKELILCPFHHEKTPSFLIDKSKDRFKCFGCNISGDSIALYALARGLDNKTAIKQLALELGLIDNNYKTRPNYEIKKEIQEQKLIKATQEQIEETYIGLCNLLHKMQGYIDIAENMQELELISAIVQEKDYVEYLLECLLERYSKTGYLKAFVEAEEVIKKWALI